MLVTVKRERLYRKAFRGSVAVSDGLRFYLLLCIDSNEIVLI
jgi:hypothetical protein